MTNEFAQSIEDRTIRKIFPRLLHRYSTSIYGYLATICLQLECLVAISNMDANGVGGSMCIPIGMCNHRYVYPYIDM